jgi:hypothetical protein
LKYFDRMMATLTAMTVIIMSKAATSGIAHGSPHLSFVMDEEIEPGGRHRFGGKA